MPPQSASLFDFVFYPPLPIQVEVSDAPLAADAGLLPLRQYDDRIGLATASRRMRCCRGRATHRWPKR